MTESPFAEENGISSSGNGSVVSLLNTAVSQNGDSFVLEQKPMKFFPESTCRAEKDNGEEQNDDSSRFDVPPHFFRPLSSPNTDKNTMMKRGNMTADDAQLHFPPDNSISGSVDKKTAHSSPYVPESISVDIVDTVSEADRHGQDETLAARFRASANLLVAETTDHLTTSFIPKVFLKPEVKEKEDMKDACGEWNVELHATASMTQDRQRTGKGTGPEKPEADRIVFSVALYGEDGSERSAVSQTRREVIVDQTFYPFLLGSGGNTQLGEDDVKYHRGVSSTSEREKTRMDVVSVEVADDPVINKSLILQLPTDAAQGEKETTRLTWPGITLNGLAKAPETIEGEGNEATRQSRVSFVPRLHEAEAGDHGRDVFPVSAQHANVVVGFGWHTDAIPSPLVPSVSEDTRITVHDTMWESGVRRREANGCERETETSGISGEEVVICRDEGGELDIHPTQLVPELKHQPSVLLADEMEGEDGVSSHSAIETEEADGAVVDECGMGEKTTGNGGRVVRGPVFDEGDELEESNPHDSMDAREAQTSNENNAILDKYTANDPFCHESDEDEVCRFPTASETESACHNTSAAQLRTCSSPTQPGCLPSDDAVFCLDFDAKTSGSPEQLSRSDFVVFTASSAQEKTLTRPHVSVNDEDIRCGDASQAMCFEKAMDKHTGEETLHAFLENEIDKSIKPNVNASAVFSSSPERHFHVDACGVSTYFLPSHDDHDQRHSLTNPWQVKCGNTSRDESNRSDTCLSRFRDGEDEPQGVTLACETDRVSKACQSPKGTFEKMIFSSAPATTEGEQDKLRSNRRRDRCKDASPSHESQEGGKRQKRDEGPEMCARRREENEFTDSGKKETDHPCVYPFLPGCVAANLRCYELQTPNKRRMEARGLADTTSMAAPVVPEDDSPLVVPAPSPPPPSASPTPCRLRNGVYGEALDGALCLPSCSSTRNKRVWTCPPPDWDIDTIVAESMTPTQMERTSDALEADGSLVPLESEASISLGVSAPQMSSSPPQAIFTLSTSEMSSLSAARASMSSSSASVIASSSLPSDLEMMCSAAPPSSVSLSSPLTSPSASTSSGLLSRPDLLPSISGAAAVSSSLASDFNSDSPHGLASPVSAPPTVVCPPHALFDSHIFRSQVDRDATMRIGAGISTDVFGAAGQRSILPLVSQTSGTASAYQERESREKTSEHADGCETKAAVPETGMTNRQREHTPHTKVQRFGGTEATVTQELCAGKSGRASLVVFSSDAASVERLPAACTSKVAEHRNPEMDSCSFSVFDVACSLHTTGGSHRLSPAGSLSSSSCPLYDVSSPFLCSFGKRPDVSSVDAAGIESRSLASLEATKEADSFLKLDLLPKRRSTTEADKETRKTDTVSTVDTRDLQMVERVGKVRVGDRVEVCWSISGGDADSADANTDRGRQGSTATAGEYGIFHHWKQQNASLCGNPRPEEGLSDLVPIQPMTRNRQYDTGAEETGSKSLAGHAEAGDTTHADDRCGAETLVWWPATVALLSGPRILGKESGRRVMLLRYEGFQGFPAESAQVIFIGPNRLLHLGRPEREARGTPEEKTKEPRDAPLLDSMVVHRRNEGSVETGPEATLTCPEAHAPVLIFKRPGEPPPEEYNSDSDDGSSFSIAEILQEQARLDQEQATEETPSVLHALHSQFASLPLLTQMNAAASYRHFADQFLAWLDDIVRLRGKGCSLSKEDIERFAATLRRDERSACRSAALHH